MTTAAEPLTTITWPAAGTRLVALLGDPVGHSLSPRLHNTVFRHLGLDLVYVALPTPAAEVGRVLASLGAVGAAGANITVPHKLAALEACDVVTDEAVLVGAVNTVWWDDGAMHGTNTDASGLGAVLADTVERLGERSAVVLGTGGAARAAVVALGRAGAGVTVVGRRSDAAHALAAIAGRAGASTAGAVDLDDEAATTDAVAAGDVVVNATPLGMAGERLPDPFHTLRPDQVAHDLVYGTGGTPFVADARAAGAIAHDGTAMLVAQAAEGYAQWTGERAPAGLYAQVLASR